MDAFWRSLITRPFHSNGIGFISRMALHSHPHSNGNSCVQQGEHKYIVNNILLRLLIQSSMSLFKNLFFFFSKYPRLQDTSFTEITAEEYKMVLATGKPFIYSLYRLLFFCVNYLL